MLEPHIPDQFVVQHLYGQQGRFLHQCDLYYGPYEVGKDVESFNKELLRTDLVLLRKLSALQSSAPVLLCGKKKNIQFSCQDFSLDAEVQTNSPISQYYKVLLRLVRLYCVIQFNAISCTLYRCDLVRYDWFCCVMLRKCKKMWYFPWYLIECS